MTTPSPDNALDHVVVVMFENRSFDNLLGRLYEPAEVGFLADYISVLTDELGRQPTVDEYSQIMTGYTPQQMPVLSAIRSTARQRTPSWHVLRADRPPPRQQRERRCLSRDRRASGLPPISTLSLQSVRRLLRFGPTAA